MHCQFANRISNGDDDFLKVIAMNELARVSKEMGQFTSDVFAFLEDYKDALDPEACIEPSIILEWQAIELESDATIRKEMPLEFQFGPERHWGFREFSSTHLFTR